MDIARVLAAVIIASSFAVADDQPRADLKQILHIDNQEFPLQIFRPTRSGQSNWSKGESWTLLQGAGYVRPVQAGQIADLSVRIQFPRLKEGEAAETRFGFVFADGQIGLLGLGRKQGKDKETAEWRVRRLRERPVSDVTAREFQFDGGLKDGLWTLAVQYGAATISFGGKELGRASFETHDAPIVGVAISQEASSVVVLDLLCRATEAPAALLPAEQELLREASTLNEAGKKAFLDKQFDAAIEKTRAGLDRYRELHKSPHPNLANSLYNVAVVLRTAGKLAESEPYFAESIQIRAKLFGADHPDTGMLEMEFATALAGQNKLAEAAAHCVRAHASYLRYFGSEHPLTDATRKMLEKLPAPQQ